VLIEQDAQGNRTTFPVQPGGVAVDVPLVGLVNEGTASSAEIVAGALQDHHRAVDLPLERRLCPFTRHPGMADR